MTGPIRVFVADDHELVRGGFRMILDGRDDITTVGEAGDGASAVAGVAALTGSATAADVVLLDVQMPELDGIEAARRILAHDPAVRVVMVTTFDDEHLVQEALRAGASGFVLKDMRPDELVDAVRVVHRGDALLAPAVTRRLLSRFAAQAPPATVPGALAALTDREREVLELLARGLTNAEIAEQLVVSAATVKTHVTAILRKLPARDRVQAVIAAYDCGLVRPGPSD